MYENKRKKRRGIVLLGVLLLVVLSGYLWQQIDHNPKNLIAGEFPNVKDARKMTEKEMSNYQQQQVDESQFTLTLFPTATFNEKTSEGNIYIKNEPVNAYPINVKVTLDQDQTLVYESGMIQPGFEVSEAKLTKQLKEGTHKATATVDIYDNKTKEKRGTTQAVVNIIINEQFNS